MSVYRVALKDLAPQVQRLHAEAMARVTRAIRIEVHTTGMRLLQEEIDATDPKPVDRGTYRGKWRAVDLATGAAILNPLPYAAVIERGRRPGARMPPPDLLGAWARRKGLLRDLPKREMRAAQRSIGFALARTIQRRGLPARNILWKTVQRLLPYLRREVAKAAVV